MTRHEISWEDRIILGLAGLILAITAIAAPTLIGALLKMIS